MREETQTFKTKINETATELKRWKVWERRPPAEKTDPFPGSGNKLRATLLCMILAHSRGRLHCRTVWGREPGRRVELTSLADQRKFIEIKMSYGWKPSLSEAEQKIAKQLLDWGDIGRLARPEAVIPVAVGGAA